jgi:hypothetical protein
LVVVVVGRRVGVGVGWGGVGWGGVGAGGCSGCTIARPRGLGYPGPHGPPPTAPSRLCCCCCSVLGRPPRPLPTPRWLRSSSPGRCLCCCCRRATAAAKSGKLLLLPQRTKPRPWHGMASQRQAACTQHVAPFVLGLSPARPQGDLVLATAAPRPRVRPPKAWPRALPLLPRAAFAGHRARRQGLRARGTRGGARQPQGRAPVAPAWPGANNLRAHGLAWPTHGHARTTDDAPADARSAS